MAHMYIWSECVASRGCQEIGSCLLKHFKNNVSTKVTKIWWPEPKHQSDNDFEEIFT